MTFINVSIILSIGSPLIPLFVGIAKKDFSRLWFYALMCCLFELLTSSLKHYFTISYQWPANLFVLTEFAFFISYFFRQLSLKNVGWKAVATFALAFFIFHTTLVKGWLLYNTNGRAVLNITYIAFSLYGYFLTMKERRTMFLEQSRFFWANTAIFTYSAGSFFIFLLKEHLITENAESFLLIWQTIHSYLNILKNILLGIALSKKEEQ